MDWQCSTSFSVASGFEVAVKECQMFSVGPNLRRSVVSEQTEQGFVGPSSLNCYQSCRDSELVAFACLALGATIELPGSCWPTFDGSYFKLRFREAHSDSMLPICSCSEIRPDSTWVSCGCSRS